MNQRIQEIARPGGRDLTEAELTTIATEIAGHPDLWSQWVVHHPRNRTYERLLHDRNLDVWLLCWSPGHDTGFHDHDLSAGAVAVARGSVREERLALGRPVDSPIVRVAEAGSSFSFSAADIHRVLHAGEVPAVTVHAYSPALVRMGSYTIDPPGQLHRHVVCEQEELQPLPLRGRR